jgi:hypothetical protein
MSTISRIRIAVIASAALAMSPNLSAAATWYIAQNIASAACIVTATQPNAGTYRTLATASDQASATAAMRNMGACNPVSSLRDRDCANGPGSGTCFRLYPGDDKP